MRHGPRHIPEPLPSILILCRRLEYLECFPSDEGTGMRCGCIVLIKILFGLTLYRIFLS